MKLASAADRAMAGNGGHWSGRTVRPEALSDDERALWRQLCDTRESLQSPFYSLGFVEAVAASGADVLVCVLDRDGIPQGFFPFQFVSPLHRRLRTAERVGGNLSDYCGIVAAASVRLAPRHLLKCAGLTHFAFDHMDETQLAHGLTARSPVTGLRILLPDGGEAYWRELHRTDPKFVGDTERRERKLERDHGPLRLVFRCRPPDVALARVIAQKRQQYSATGAADPLRSDASRRLLVTLAERQDDDCAGIVSELFAGDTWVASHLGLRRRGTFHYWFPVYNHDLRHYAPGRLLLKAIIALAADEGISTIDRGAGDSAAKRDFANATHRYMKNTWYTASARGCAWEAYLSLRWRLETRAAARPRLTS